MVPVSDTPAHETGARSDIRPAARAAALGARLLFSACFQPPGVARRRMGEPVRPPARLQLRRPGTWLGDLQPAFYGSPSSGRIQRCSAQPHRRQLQPRQVENHDHAYGHTARHEKLTAYRRRACFRAYRRRVRRSAHDRGKYRQRNKSCLHRHLRSGGIARLPIGPPIRGDPVRILLCDSHGSLSRQ